MSSNYSYGVGVTSSPVLTNVIFSGNRAESGGGMHNGAYDGGTSSPMLTNVIFNGNYASDWGVGCSTVATLAPSARCW